MSMFGAVDLSSLAPRAGAPATGAGAAPGAAGSPVGAGAAEGPAVPAPLIVDVDAANLRDVAQISTQVPVVLVLHTPRSEASTELADLLGRLAQEYAGRFELGRVDADAAPEVAQALQAQAVPAIIALLGGQPVPVLQGPVEEEQLRGILDQVLEVAARNGVSGRLDVDAPAEEEAEPEETEVERQAREALERGDYAAAEEVYNHAIAQSPADETLKVARAQVRILARMEGQDPQALLAAADAPGAGVEEQLAGADAALALGDLSAALGRGLEAVRTSAGEDRETARVRLLELFEVIGAGTPEVARARRQLATLLF